MSLQTPASRRDFTNVARAAALEARRRKQAASLTADTPEVFIVRMPGAPPRFGWEIRRFHAVVVKRGIVDDTAACAAHPAGRKILSGLMAGA